MKYSASSTDMASAANTFSRITTGLYSNSLSWSSRCSAPTSAPRRGSGWDAAAPAPTVHLAAILRTAHPFEQSTERDIERRILVRPRRLGTNDRTLANEGEFHPV